MEEISLSDFKNRQKPKSVPPKKGIVITPRMGQLAVAVLVLAASFVAGMQYQKGKTQAIPQTSTASATTPQQPGGFGGTGGSGGQGGFGGGFRRNRAIGTVTAVSSSSVTVQTRSGSSATYTISSSTTVTNDGQSASVSDIQTGDTVFITLDSSNANNADSIALNPSFGSPGSSTQTQDPNATSTNAIGA